jgi:drug/metabolite transporter superfamily protein YnfA
MTLTAHSMTLFVLAGLCEIGGGPGFRIPGT